MFAGASTATDAVMRDRQNSFAASANFESFRGRMASRRQETSPRGHSRDRFKSTSNLSENAEEVKRRREMFSTRKSKSHLDDLILAADPDGAGTGDVTPSNQVPPLPLVQLSKDAVVKKGLAEDGSGNGELTRTFTVDAATSGMGLIRDLRKRASQLNTTIFSFALLGIFIMIAETEYVETNRINRKIDIISIVLRCILSASTLILVTLLVLYYNTLWAVERAQSTLCQHEPLWSSRLLTKFIVEVIVCLIHSPPGVTFVQIYMLPKSALILTPDRIDIFMFLRLYLLPRYMRFHSRLNSSGARFISSLNHVGLSTSFTMKTALHWHPKAMLGGLIVLLVVGAAHALRICEKKIDSDFEYYGNSVWILLVTITTVGYGDIYPTTTCGRTVVVMSAMVGVVITSVLIAVFQLALRFDRAQMRVLQFLEKDRSRKKLRNLAARSVQATLRVHLLRRRNKSTFFARRELNDVLHRWQITRRKARGVGGDQVALSTMMLETLLLQVHKLREDVLGVGPTASVTDSPRRQNSPRCGCQDATQKGAGVVDANTGAMTVDTTPGVTTRGLGAVPGGGTAATADVAALAAAETEAVSTVPESQSRTSRSPFAISVVGSSGDMLRTQPSPSPVPIVGATPQQRLQSLEQKVDRMTGLLEQVLQQQQLSSR